MSHWHLLPFRFTVTDAGGATSEHTFYAATERDARRNAETWAKRMGLNLTGEEVG